MNTQSLEAEIERAWVALCCSARKRTVYLVPGNRLMSVGLDEEEVGTYTTAVALKDFREDVYFAHENRGRRHG